jgi:hypothetical protein
VVVVLVVVVVVAVEVEQRGLVETTSKSEIDVMMLTREQRQGKNSMKKERNRKLLPQSDRIVVVVVDAWCKRVVDECAQKKNGWIKQVKPSW